MHVYITGSPEVISLPEAVTKRLDQIVDKGYDILVGDNKGFDSAIQKYFSMRKYRRVTIYVSGQHTRYNEGAFGEVHIPCWPGDSAVEFARLKNDAMIADADCAIAVWDGYSRAVRQDLEELLECGKKVLLYWNGKMVLVQGAGELEALRKVV